MATNNGINMRCNGNNTWLPTSIVGSGNPNSTQSGSIGDIYFDTAAGLAYTCTTTGSSSTAVWTVNAPTFNWLNVTGAAQTMSPNNGYIANNGSGVTAFTLPTTIAVGQRLSIRGGASTSWSIVQGTGQLIHWGSITTTSGAGGSVSSSNQYDQFDLICITANTTFSASSPQGNPNYV